MSTHESFDIDLEHKINFLRLQMIATGMLKGLNHPDTIEYSQQLDRFLNTYTKVQQLEKANV